MKGKTALIVLIAVVATAASVFVGTRAITGSIHGDRSMAASSDAAPGEIQSKGVEAEKLVGDIEQSSSGEAVTKDDRDPMVKYVAKPKPKPQSETSTPPPPRFPSYTVKTLFLDDDPMAIMKRGDDFITVRIGDEIEGGKVTAIESDGVTLEGPAGTKKYPY